VEIPYVAEYYEPIVDHPALYILTDSMWKAEGFSWGPSSTNSSCNKNSDWSSVYEDLTENKDEKKYILAYTHPIIAILLNRIRNDEDHQILWECSGKVRYITVDKIAHCEKLKTERFRPVTPKISIFTRMKFGFACVTKIYNESVFYNWVLDWIGGKDRSIKKIKEIENYFSQLIVKEQGKKETDYAEVTKLFCVYWMCLAAQEAHAGSEKLAEKFTALAALEAVRFAHDNKVKDFDLVKIAECIMSAR
jgi:hypothetical protein